MTAARWTFVLVVLAACAVTASAVFAGKKPRPEPEDGNFWDCQSVDLGDTGFQASGGPWGTKDPVYYSVGVERKLPGGGAGVYFEAQLKVDGLPKGFIDKRIDKVVKYDENLRMVTFDLGDQQIRYKIPSP